MYTSLTKLGFVRESELAVKSVQKRTSFGKAAMSKWGSVAGTKKYFSRLLLLIALALPTFADTRKPVVNPDPEYPEIARRMNITGTVKLEIVIATDGSIKSVKVLGGHPLLVDAVQKALKKWKYAPGSAESTIQVDFKF